MKPANNDEVICLLTKGPQDAVVSVIVHKAKDINDPQPPVIIEHTTGQYMLVRRWADRAFLYRPVEQIDVDSLD